MGVPTNDFIDDVVDVLNANGNQYIIIVRELGQSGTEGCRVISEMSGWMPAGDVSLRDDIIQLLDVTVFNEEDGWVRR